ncbi:hypothetical protein SAMN05444380_1441 [Thermophagus xiamenensis]|uniref:Uncharacterized protein n=1 Tax=Thermophagus xiamenensis TaxID=385682 RepID=A0A1I2FZX8_9BACT|nr:hypothetical protein SAMN05444380_1441 [Thermophagus xiamenensis]
MKSENCNNPLQLAHCLNNGLNHKKQQLYIAYYQLIVSFIIYHVSKYIISSNLRLLIN